MDIYSYSSSLKGSSHKIWYSSFWSERPKTHLNLKILVSKFVPWDLEGRLPWDFEGRRHGTFFVGRNFHSILCQHDLESDVSIRSEYRVMSKPCRASNRLNISETSDYSTGDYQH